MSTSPPPRHNSRAERIIAWAIIVLVVAGVLAFEVVITWIASTSPIIVGSAML
jgi:hypothetical protein